MEEPWDIGDIMLSFIIIFLVSSVMTGDIVSALLADSSVGEELEYRTLVWLIS